MNCHFFMDISDMFNPIFPVVDTQFTIKKISHLPALYVIRKKLPIKANQTIRIIILSQLFPNALKIFYQKHL